MKILVLTKHKFRFGPPKGVVPKGRVGLQPLPFPAYVGETEGVHMNTNYKQLTAVRPTV
jgi:hypothetical protein